MDKKYNAIKTLSQLDLSRSARSSLSSISGKSDFSNASAEKRFNEAYAKDFSITPPIPKAPIKLAPLKNKPKAPIKLAPLKNKPKTPKPATPKPATPKPATPYSNRNPRPKSIQPQTSADSLHLGDWDPSTPPPPSPYDRVIYYKTLTKSQFKREQLPDAPVSWSDAEATLNKDKESKLLNEAMKAKDYETVAKILSKKPQMKSTDVMTPQRLVDEVIKTQPTNIKFFAPPSPLSLPKAEKYGSKDDEIDPEYSFLFNKNTPTDSKYKKKQLKAQAEDFSPTAYVANEVVGDPYGKYDDPKRLLKAKPLIDERLRRWVGRKNSNIPAKYSDEGDTTANYNQDYFDITPVSTPNAKSKSKTPVPPATPPKKRGRPKGALNKPK